jgi:hypothetical protein
VAARSATTAAHSGTRSVARTWPVGPTSVAAASATTPGPVATSSTRSPGAGRIMPTSRWADTAVLGAARSA